MFCCFITGICVFFGLTVYYRHGHNLGLLKSTIKWLEIRSTSAWDRRQLCQSIQDGGQSLKSPGICDQYPRDTIKPAGHHKTRETENHVNSMRSNQSNSCSLLYLSYHNIAMGLDLVNPKTVFNQGTIVSKQIFELVQSERSNKILEVDRFTLWKPCRWR